MFHVFGYSCWDGEKGAEGAVELSGLRAGAKSGAEATSGKRNNNQRQQSV